MRNEKNKNMIYNPAEHTMYEFLSIYMYNARSDARVGENT